MSDTNLIVPFEIIPEGQQLPNEKLYLVLLYISSGEDSVEDTQTFKFITGRQATYDYIKELLESGEMINIMESKVLVDSPKISISHKCSVFTFMRDMKEKNLVADDSTFSIYEYKEDDYEQQE